VKLFAMFTGIVPEDHLGHEPWQFLLKVLYCVRLLMDVNWRLLVKAWPTDRGAPLPLPAIMDLLANLYNAENPTELQVHLPTALLRGHAWCSTRVAASRHNKPTSTTTSVMAPVSVQAQPRGIYASIAARQQRLLVLPTSQQQHNTQHPRRAADRTHSGGGAAEAEPHWASG
jgi:hypothetical protein